MFIPLLMNGIAPQVGIPLSFLLSSFLLCPTLDKPKMQRKMTFTNLTQKGIEPNLNEFITVFLG